jgi:hypothetical protein
MKPTALLNQQLEAMMITLNQIPETDLPGNAAYYLNHLVHLVANNGVDEPLVGKFWHQEDLNERLQERDMVSQPVTREHARELFAMIDRTHDAEMGINYGVLDCALEECLPVQGGVSCN